jgi:hypothetical protein
MGNLDGSFENEERPPAISLHAIIGAREPWTMRVKGTMGLCKFVLLVDSGSTHNFINTTMTQIAVFLPTQGGKLEVLVANGEQLINSEFCRGITIRLGNVSFLVDFYILDLEGCEAVLGAVWLRGLGPILWDFSSLWMSFVWQGEKVVLHGLTTPADRMVDGPKFFNLLHGCSRGAIL